MSGEELDSSEQASCSSPGQVLAAARDAVGVTRREVAEALNLPLRTIEAIENDDEARLPAKVFARGYIRAYAKLLEIDPDPLVVMLDRDQDGQADTEALPPDEPRETTAEGVVSDSGLGKFRSVDSGIFNFGFFNRAMFKRVIESRISGFAKLGISTQKLAGLGSGIAVVVIVAFLISMVFGRDESPTTPSAELPRAPELMLDVPGEAAESSNEPTAVAIDSQGQTENQLQSKSKN